MFAKLCKSIFQRTLVYQRRGLTTLRHALILCLGVGVATVVLMVSGHSPFMPAPAQAGAVDLALTTLSIVSAFTDVPSITNMFVSIVGSFLTGAVGLLMVLVMYLAGSVASYDVTINTPNVIAAWKVLRDVVNLFFVIILLVIAIGTTLRREQYMWNKNLPRFIIAVVFVNFSRTIVAFVTDFADVVQQTFVSGFTVIIFSKLVNAFGIVNFLQLTTIDLGAGGFIPGSSELVVTTGIIVAIVMEFIVTAIMFVYFSMFLVRVVGLWLLAIFGPVAFVSSILPQTQKYYKDWWSKLSNLAILGPMLAFFMWLGITLVPDPYTGAATFGGAVVGFPVQVGAASQPLFIIGFCLMTIILYFGLQQGMGLASDFGSFVGRAQSFAFGTVLGGVSGAAAFAGKDLWSRVDSGQMRGRQAASKYLQSNLTKGSLAYKAAGALGAGGTFTGSLTAFRDRALENQKRRLEPGAEANKKLANDVGNWPTQQLVQLTVGRVQGEGAVETAVASANLKISDIMRRDADPLETRHKDATSEVEAAQKTIDQARDSGAISADKARELTEQLNEGRNLAEVKQWEKSGDLKATGELVDKRKGDVSKANAEVNRLTKAIEQLDRQILAQVAIVQNPASTTDQVNAAETEALRLTGLQEPLKDDRADAEVQKQQATTSLEGLETRLAGLFAEANKWVNSGKQLEDSDLLRSNATQLMASGNTKTAGGNMIGRAMVNLGREPGTQLREDQKARWDSAIKQNERYTGGDPDNNIDYIISALKGKKGDMLQAGLMGLAKSKDMDMLTTGRMQPEYERLATQKFKDNGASDDQIGEWLKEFRKAPAAQEYTADAQQLFMEDALGGDMAAAAKVLSLIRAQDYSARGATPAMTYTDTSTGQTKLIEMKHVIAPGEPLKLEFDDRALRAVGQTLKGMKAGDFVSDALRSANIFKKDADGNTRGVSALFSKYMNAMPANITKHMHRLNAGFIQDMKENQEYLREQIAANPTKKEWKKMELLLGEMDDAELFKTG